MAKKSFVAPMILLNSEPGDDVVIGGGTGQGSPDGVPASPCSYSFWLDHFKEDIIQDDIIDEYDFGTWWSSMGFSKDDWENLNPALSWDEYVGD